MFHSYIIIKPDGEKFFDEILYLLNKQFNVCEVLKIENFDKACMPLYLDDAAIERGNVPVITGIAEIWKRYYCTSAYYILLANKTYMRSHSEMINAVCDFKKNFRKEHLPPYGYIESKLNLEDIPYQEYGYHFAENLFRKRAEIGYDGWTYTLQINAIHSPDSVDAYIRETTCLKPFLK